MKVKIENSPPKIDLKPEEARKLMGLPEVDKMQDELMAQIKDKLQQEINTMTDPQAFMERYLPLGMQGVEQRFQKMMNDFTSMGSKKK